MFQDVPGVFGHLHSPPTFLIQLKAQFRQICHVLVASFESILIVLFVPLVLVIVVLLFSPSIFYRGSNFVEHAVLPGGGFNATAHQQPRLWQIQYCWSAWSQLRISSQFLTFQNSTCLYFSWSLLVFLEFSRSYSFPNYAKVGSRILSCEKNPPNTSKYRKVWESGFLGWHTKPRCRSFALFCIQATHLPSGHQVQERMGRSSLAWTKAVPAVSWK